jgi:quercetin dioxygenase-like cupin family protein
MTKKNFFMLLTGLLTLSSLSSLAADSNQEFLDLVNGVELIDSANFEIEQGFVIIQSTDLDWDENSNELQQKVIYGDPSKEGLYILRARFPAGVTSLPHFHSQDRFVSVIEGDWYAGTDASHDINRTTKIPEGGFMIHPAGAVHFDGANHEAPVIVEIRGMGPVVTEAVIISP